MNYSSLSEMFFTTCRKFSERTGILYKEEGGYQPLKFKEIQAAVASLAGGLISLGVKKGDRVVIFSENCKEWAFFDYAILSLGAISVPIYATLLPKDVEYIINDCEAKIVVVSNLIQFGKLLEIEKGIRNVEKYVLIDPAGVNHPKAIPLERFYEIGQAYLEENPGVVEKSVAGLTRSDLATFIYTSGTTGEPKGVMLTHENFLSNIEASARAIPVTENDTFLSFLPLSHVFERMAGHFFVNHQGAAIAYAESIETVPQNLQEVRPTVMTSVPRLFEKIYARVVGSVEEGSPLKRKLFHWAIGVGRVVTEYRQKNKPLPGGLKIKYAVANKLVFSKLKERVGGRIRFFASGGAPLAKEIGEFFTAAGLMILEGYGLTETSPIITLNRFEKFKFGSVGTRLDNVEVKIAEDGEILTRGPHVMQGYYKKPEETREAIDSEKWLYTGDIGHIDEDGMLVITDRKKNIIVTAGGKNVAPQKMENLLATSRYIDQVLVIGDRRKYCAAIIVPNGEVVGKFAQGKGIAYPSLKELYRNPGVVKLIQSEVDAVNAQCASYEQIKKFILLDQPFSIESGELTPSLKIKRKIVEKNYREEIETLYRD
ncbi:MAG: long-chain fatty acid--CoA ligase [Calditrichaceae bacterium]|nr:long-chain fatty acid--CoA ligase [Calditrichia bacterium]NUQ40976.1 long-chain fatty acid--CoA ligase [Calditrichaceae bacterium]